MRPREVNPRSAAQRVLLRTAGAVLSGLGVTLTLVGAISFFASFGSLEPPRYFWCAFLGLPLLGIGVALLKAGYLGTIARYVAGEMAPVAGDALNHVAGRTRDGVREVASAIREGLRGEAVDPEQPACGKCGHANDAEARFCDQCGAPMPTARQCRQCQAQNDAGAQFCSACGKQLAAG